MNGRLGFQKALVSLACVVIALSGIEIRAQQTFRSLVGRFEVETPANRGGQSGFAGGVQHKWKVSSADVSIGFVDRRGYSRAVRDGEFSAEEFVLGYYNQFSQRGERVSATAIELSGNPAHEFRYRTEKTSFVVRVLRVEDRIYSLDANFPLDDEAELLPKILKIFNSFRLIPDESVEKEIEKLVADATPEPFPNTAKPTKLVSDVVDLRLKGKPRTVITETARFGSDQSLMGRKPTKLEVFDERGFLTSEIEYDSYGMPFRIFAYGFLDGKRVARVNTVESETALVGIAFPVDGKFDDRYDEYYVHRYVSGKLTEVRNFWSNNALYSRTTYRYAKNTRTIEYFDGGSRPFSRVIEEIGEHGNPTKLTPYERDGNRPTGEAPFEVEYDKFDDEGNWTQRSTFRRYGLDGMGKRFGVELEYRTITYY